MQHNVIALVLPPPTENQLLQRIRAFAVGSESMRLDHPHFQERLKERGLNMRQVIETVRKGCAVGTPKLDEWGDWRIKLRRVVAGRRVQVVVAVKSDHFVVVTVI